jgi:hypothetical protein
MNYPASASVAAEIVKQGIQRALGKLLFSIDGVVGLLYSDGVRGEQNGREISQGEAAAAISSGMKRAGAGAKTEQVVSLLYSEGFTLTVSPGSMYFSKLANELGIAPKATGPGPSLYDPRAPEGVDPYAPMQQWIYQPASAKMNWTPVLLIGGVLVVGLLLMRRK